MLGNRHPCTINNGGCGDLCLIHPGGTYKCECPDNFYLSVDRRICLPNCSYTDVSGINCVGVTSWRIFYNLDLSLFFYCATYIVIFLYFIYRFASG